MPEPFPYKIRSIPMTGRLIEALDPVSVGENFRELKNLRPTAANKRSVAGMTKVTSTPLSFADQSGRAAKIRSAIHFVKEEPYESHIVVEAYNYAENSLRLYTLEGDVPDPDDFGDVLYSIAEPWEAATVIAKGTVIFPTTHNGRYYECAKAGTTHATTEPTWPTTPLATIIDNTIVWVCREGTLHGTFSVTTGSTLIYANAHIILTWPGEEHCAGAVINASQAAFPMPQMDDMFDFTNHLQNTFIDDENIAVLTGLDVHVVGNVSHYDADVYIGSPYKIDGAKFYIRNPVGYTSTTTYCETAYWKSGGMQSVENTDDTKVDTHTLAQTGSIIFIGDTTAAVEPTLIFGRMLYWYRFRFHNVPASGANRPILYFVTVHAPIQMLTNIWDGTPTPLLAAWKNPSVENYIDNTLAIAETDGLRQRTGDGWVNNPDLTMKLSGFATNDYVLLGSFVRLAGFQTTMPKEARNKRAAIIRVDYFNGSEWVALTDIRDGTSNTGRSFWQSGTVTWTPPAATNEFKTCVNNDMELYYYRLHWSASLSASGVLVDKIVGVPHPVMLTGHTRAFVAQDRLFLVKDNRLECSPVSRPTVMNGSEHAEFAMGDESDITGGCHLFTIQGSEYYSPILVFKKTATYLLTGSGPSWQRHELSRYDGLAAPDTLCVVNLPISIPGMGTTIAVGQGTTGVFICDGRPPRIVSKDIEQYFDPLHADYIQPDMIDKSVGFMDYERLEYHWLFMIGVGHTYKEMVLNLHTMEWYEIVRGNNPLRSGFPVTDTHRKDYVYGICEDGHVKRLEHGTDFDGDPIACTMWPGDVSLAGDPTIETRVEQVQILCIAKTITEENLTYDHYLDTNYTAMDRDITLAPQADGKRVVNMIAKVKSPYAVFHSGKVVFSCDDEAIAFEPLAMMYHYEVEHQRVKPNQGDTPSGRAWLYSEGD
jgi:hypothetical protein